MPPRLGSSFMEATRCPFLLKMLLRELIRLRKKTVILLLLTPVVAINHKLPTLFEEMCQVAEATCCRRVYYLGVEV
ncbi:unnamed protein product [Eruca vesicaria subsp. sativa]|uniref:Uncharacterized protein n=1 Tax=Eruca vesicaria subsp. sativa TaxID=29727 RepID=A0ABC8JN65_ERUVS|nr:unnamed protein product [Eruca vesicaria subsp. sativa]